MDLSRLIIGFCLCFTAAQLFATEGLADDTGFSAVETSVDSAAEGFANTEPTQSFAETLEAYQESADRANNDPWEPFNRQVFAFNEGVDRFVLRPVAKGYHDITPDPLERRVSSFLSNLGEVNNIFNAVLQGRADGVVHSTGRFLLNTTLGLAGFFDVASEFGVKPSPADFGQTLAVWGVEQGPFLMVPFLGPQTVRGGAGLTVDGFASLPYAFGEREQVWALYAIGGIDTRARLLDAEELISGDKYIFTRNAYLQRREYFLSGEVDDSFSDYEEENYEEF